MRQLIKPEVITAGLGGLRPRYTYNSGPEMRHVYAIFQNRPVVIGIKDEKYDHSTEWHKETYKYEH